MSARNLNLFKAIDFLIRIKTGPDAGKVYKIQPPSIEVGRDPACQIVLSDLKASRRQFAIHFADQVLCKDLSSRKTTLINGKPANNKPLRPGDIISFGETAMEFQTRANTPTPPKLEGAEGQKQATEKAGSRKRFTIFAGIIAILAVGLFLLDDSSEGGNSQTLATQADVQRQIDESKERTSRLKESYAEKRKMANSRYMQSVEKHFISGFRDFQNGQYGRAIESFGTTIATDQSHARAQQYSKSAQKKRADLIDTHMRDGAKYREKMMYNRCAAEFEKSIVLINDPNSKKYKLALTQLKECRLLKTGRY